MEFLDLIEEETLQIPEADLDETTALTLHSIHAKKISVEFPHLLNNRSYVLRSKGYVGQIPITDDLLLRIHPKVPIDNLFRMLEYAYNLESFDFLEGHISVESIDDLFERLAAILAKSVLNRARKGLYRGYVGEEQPLPYLRGRVLVMPSLRSAMRGSTRLECEFEEHTANLDDNRILAWTLFRLPKFRLQRDEVRRQVRQAYRVLARTVEVTAVEAKECVRRLYHRLNEDYRPMHGLCRFFLEHCAPGVEVGEHNFIPFVLNMPSLFESFVAEWLKANPPSGISVTQQYKADLDESGMFFFRIDLVLKEAASDKVIAVMDTKYKRKEHPEASDIEQIAAYAVRMKTQNAFLIYPSTVTQCRVLWDQEDMRVQNLIFDIAKDPKEAGKLFLEKLEDTLALQ